MTETSGFLERPDAERLAWRRVKGEGPTLIWVGGWRSDMEGTKAQHLADAARVRGWDFLRYDHFAHGASSGDWTKAVIGRWREDLIAVIDALSDGPVVLIGSSMGGWVSCLAAIARPDRIGALTLVAPAPDFAHALMWPSLTDTARREILEQGFHLVTDGFDGPHELTRTFFDEARRWSILENSVPITAPVRILQGMQDEPVPWRHALMLAEAIEGDDVVMTLIRDGDHRLSRPQDLERLALTVAEARTLASGSFPD